MTTDLISRMQSVKGKADRKQIDRENYQAYVADRVENGWTADDVAEYRAEVERIMQSGTEDEKQAAREFWELKTKDDAAKGINQRIRADIVDRKRKAA